MMNDTNQQNAQSNQPNQQQGQQPVMDQFGGALPFTNIPQQPANNQGQVVTGGASPESGVFVKHEQARPAENAPEVKRAPENKPEKQSDIERKDLRSYYPNNGQQGQSQGQPAQVNPIKPPVGPKFFGYMVSPQISGNFKQIASMKGKGDVNKSRTWLYMLLDRILKKQTFAAKKAKA